MWSGCIALVLLVAWLDATTGAEARVFPLYYIPIAWAASAVSRRAGAATALISTALWGWGMSLSGVTWSAPLFLFNIVTQSSSFLLVAILVGRLAKMYHEERELSRQDNLTRLPNRRSFFELAELMFASSRRWSRPVTLAYVDLDNFKLVNDQGGHAEGDRALLEAARVLRRTARKSDVVARLGGDEFAVLLPDTSLEQARHFLQRLSEQIVSAMKQKEWPITASIGAVTFEPPPELVEQALHVADELMYRVKTMGKNHFLIERSSAPHHPES